MTRKSVVRVEEGGWQKRCMGGYTISICDMCALRCLSIAFLLSNHAFAPKTRLCLMH